MTSNFAQLFAAPSWSDIERAIHAAPTEADDPHTEDLRRLLKQHGYSRPADTDYRGLGLADMLRYAEERRAERILAEREELERGTHA